MRSTTSLFNPVIYRKTMGRFWPLWALYGVIWLFMIPLLLFNTYMHGGWGDQTPAQTLFQEACELLRFLQPGVWLAFIFSILCTMAVFGYLYQGRSSCMMHALPVRRETLFCTQYLAGLSFLLLPQLAAGVLAAATEMALLPTGCWAAALKVLGLLLLGQSGLCLFFFSFAVFCAMFTSHILALPVFYGVFNGLVALIYSLICLLMSQFIYGFPVDMARVFSGPFRWLTPLYCLTEATGINYGVDGAQGVLRDPKVIAIYAAAGVVLALAALWVYRMRHVESAGDVVAIALVRPVFRCGVSVCSGLCLGTFTSEFFGLFENPIMISLFVLFWGAVGYFAAEMLLKKTFRVSRAWKGCLGMVAALAVLCFVGCFDLFGVADKVPAADKTESVTVTADMGQPGDDGGLNGTFTEPAQIEQIRTLHKAILDRHDNMGSADRWMQDAEASVTLQVTYHLKNGRTVAREYYGVPVQPKETEKKGSVTWAVQQIHADRDLIAECYGFDRLEKSRLVDACLDYLVVPGEEGLNSLWLEEFSRDQLKELWAAVRKDFDAGTLGNRYLFETEALLDHTYATMLTFTFEVPMERGTTEETMCINLTPDAVNTLTWLKQAGVLGGPEGCQPVPYRQWASGEAMTYEDDLEGPEEPEAVIETETAAIAR